MTPKIDLALWCLTALMSLLPEGASPSYREKYLSIMEKRVPLCVDTARRAEELGLDPLIAIAVGTYESKFDKTAKSSKGARGILQLTPIALKSWCSPYSMRTGKPSTLPSRFATPSQIRRCDKIKAGILYLKHEDERDPDLCSALARYNAGPKGSCRGRGGVYGRGVLRVMSDAHLTVLEHYKTLDIIQRFYDPDEEREESCDDQVQGHP